MISCVLCQWKNPSLLGSSFLDNFKIQATREIKHFNFLKNGRFCKKRGLIVCGLPLLVDPWAPSIDSQSIASQLFAVSLFPYIGFLYFITKSKSAPRLTLFGFYFLLAFVGATKISFFLGNVWFQRKQEEVKPILAKLHYGTSLSNVDWLHGGAESLLTLTNLFIVLGLRKALRETKNEEESKSNGGSATKDENNPLL